MRVLQDCFESIAPVSPGDGIVVAFSGGPDSSALLLALARCGAQLGLRVYAAHLDHGLDAQSESRARLAAELAQRIGVESIVERRVVAPTSGGGLEAEARDARYRFLEECRLRLSARYVLTAHHRDDQAETVLLRLLQGSSLLGLAGVQVRRGSIVRPLLSWSRHQVAAWLARQDPALLPVADPTNLDLSRSRNHIRHRLLPALEQNLRVEDAAPLGLRLARLAQRMQSLRPALEELLLDQLDCPAAPTWHSSDLAPGSTDESARRDLSIDAAAFRALPRSLRALALAALHRRAGAPYPASTSAALELDRQLLAAERKATARVGCDCGPGWSWRLDRGRLHLHHARAQERKPAALAFFSYTTSVPGSLAVPQLSLQLRLRRGSLEEWHRLRELGTVAARLDGGIDAATLLAPEPDADDLVRARAFLELPLVEGAEVTVRNRRPGDRLQPLGCSYQRRLKEILIDRRVPRDLRNSLPLLCVEGQVAWVPTVTLDHRFRVTGKRTLWIAEWYLSTPNA